MTLNKEQEFLLNGIQELTEDEMMSIAGGYGDPTTPPHEHHEVWVSNPYGNPNEGSWVMCHSGSSNNSGGYGYGG